MAPRFSIIPARWLADDSPLSPSARLVLSVLGQWANSGTGECFPTMLTIVGCAKLVRSTVRRSILELEKSGAIAVEPRLDEAGDFTSNKYVILGYDPPPKQPPKGGTPAGGGGVHRVAVDPHRQAVEGTPIIGGPPIKAVKVVLTPNLNGARDPDRLSASGPGARTPTPYSGPVDLFGRVLETPPGTPPTEAERTGWRERLRAAGVIPKPEADVARAIAAAHVSPPLAPPEQPAEG